MKNGPSPRQIRNLVFLVTGSMDALIGLVFLLAWFNLLPIDLVAFLGIPRWLPGVLGAGFSLSGVVVIAWQVTKPRSPA